jgi:hypothetical protein
MGVARDGAAPFDLALQLADAAEESVVELALLEQFQRLACERLLKPCALFSLRGDDLDAGCATPASAGLRSDLRVW